MLSFKGKDARLSAQLSSWNLNKYLFIQPTYPIATKGLFQFSNFNQNWVRMRFPVEVQNPTAIPQLLNNFFPYLKINH